MYLSKNQRRRLWDTGDSQAKSLCLEVEKSLPSHKARVKRTFKEKAQFLYGLNGDGVLKDENRQGFTGYGISWIGSSLCYIDLMTVRGETTGTVQAFDLLRCHLASCLFRAEAQTTQHGQRYIGSRLNVANKIDAEIKKLFEVSDIRELYLS